MPVDNFASIDFETEIATLPVVGELPRELRGTLYRNGPNPQFTDPGHASHWFVGDGMLHAFRIEDGRISYRNRWIRTEKWQAEHAAGRALYNGFGGGAPKAPGRGLDGGVANTNIVWHAGRLLALEEAHLPTEIDPDSIDTRGLFTGAGLLKMPFTAHPKLDPATGEMVFFGYSATAPFANTLTWGLLDAAGAAKRIEVFEAPYCSMVHDFIVTPNHVVFPVLPLTGSLERAKSGRPPFAWEPEKGAFLGVMRRDAGAASLVWLEIPACYVFHVMNAWEEDGRILAEVMQADAPALFPRPDGSPVPRNPTRLTRWTIDMRAGQQNVAVVPVDDLHGEFPRLDERWAGLRNRHGYIAASHGAQADEKGFGAIAHFDRATGVRNLLTLPPGDATSEPVFVPLGAAEGDGVLLAVIWRAAEARSDLVVLDAQNIARGPLAVARLPHRVPFGFHGNWKAAA
jgi:carotenoid cleavage dioxygenase